MANLVGRWGGGAGAMASVGLKVASSGSGGGTSVVGTSSWNRDAAEPKPIDSSRQQHGTPDHDATAYNHAKKWLDDPETVGQPRFNQELVDLKGNAVPEFRPDAQRIRRLPDGRKVVDVFEVQSPSQSDDFMRGKIKAIRERLGEQAGDITWERFVVGGKRK